MSQRHAGPRLYTTFTASYQWMTMLVTTWQIMEDSAGSLENNKNSKHNKAEHRYIIYNERTGVQNPYHYMYA